MPQSYHDTRFSFDPRRKVLWRSLWKFYFSKYVKPTDCVLELGSGYGDFINSVVARRRVAVDCWPDFVRHLDQDVEGHVGNVVDVSFLADRSVDFVFASNLVEHLPQSDFQRMLQQLHRKLTMGGRI